jgi:hypothetical protein
MQFYSSRDKPEGEDKPRGFTIMANARNNHDALLVVMNPMDFLKLTTPDDDELQSIIDKVDRSLADYNSGVGEYNKSNYNLPYLNVLWPSGKIVGHEGRHRAAMVYKEGGKSFTATISFRQDYSYFVTWEQTDENGDEVLDEHGEPKMFSQPFPTLQSASAFKREIENEWRAPDYDWSQGTKSRVKVVTNGGNILRGHPERNNFNVHPWVYGKWTPADMPPALIGQYNDSIRIPTSRMKIGVVRK